jgi:hypothetical protein
MTKLKQEGKTWMNVDEDGMRNKRTSADTEVARGDQKRTKNIREERRGVI